MYVCMYSSSDQMKILKEQSAQTTARVVSVVSIYIYICIMEGALDTVSTNYFCPKASSG